MAQKKPRKPNPRRRPATQADVDRAKSKATDEAIDKVWAIFFTVLRDKESAQNEDLRRVWHECEDLADSIDKGYVSVSDLRNTLKEEAGIFLK